jgi:hypothetical protein
MAKKKGGLNLGMGALESDINKGLTKHSALNELSGAKSVKIPKVKKVKPIKGITKKKKK